jgi:Domain of unknown function (DUF4365)
MLGSTSSARPASQCVTPMVSYKRTNITSKTGLNFVRTIVEDAGSLFHKIEQENDLGIDALIEFVRNDQPLGKQIALQVKSGKSYFNSKSEQCLIPIENHRDYWSKYPLPVIGITYVPDLKRAHWVDIKPYLKQFPEAAIIRFTSGEANRLDADTFQRVFLPTILGEVPDIFLPQALSLFRSSKQDESYLGLVALFRRHPNELEVWREFVQNFVDRQPRDIPLTLIYYLAHIPWHGDIAYSGETITKETREYVRSLFGRFGRAEIEKLLGFIDMENQISRGAIGQSVEALVSSLPDVDSALSAIASDASCDMFVRECAALILAMHIGKNAKPVLKQLTESGSWYTQELEGYLDKYGWVDPYA